jgi:hypothetical protein
MASGSSNQQAHVVATLAVEAGNHVVRLLTETVVDASRDADLMAFRAAHRSLALDDSVVDLFRVALEPEFGAAAGALAPTVAEIACLDSAVRSAIEAWWRGGG